MMKILKYLQNTVTTIENTDSAGEKYELDTELSN